MEAVERLIAWAFEDPRVRSVVAETERDNIASQRVPAKLGMRRDRDVGNMIWWRLKRPVAVGGSDGRPMPILR